MLPEDYSRRCTPLCSTPVPIYSKGESGSVFFSRSWGRTGVISFRSYAGNSDLLFFFFSFFFFHFFFFFLTRPYDNQTWFPDTNYQLSLSQSMTALDQLQTGWIIGSPGVKGYLLNCCLFERRLSETSGLQRNHFKWNGKNEVRWGWMDFTRRTSEWSGRRHSSAILTTWPPSADTQYWSSVWKWLPVSGATPELFCRGEIAFSGVYCTTFYSPAERYWQRKHTVNVGRVLWALFPLVFIRHPQIPSSVGV